MTRQSIFAVALLAIGLGQAALAEELEGVPLPDQVQVGRKTLRLSGAGIRYGVMLKVYVLALHAEKPLPTAAAILDASSQVRRLTLTLLRDLERSIALRAFEWALKRNFGDDYDIWRARLAAFFAALRDGHKGERIEITTMPGKGVRVVTVDQSFEIAGDDAARAMLTIWLGEHPVSEALRDELVSRAAPPTN